MRAVRDKLYILLLVFVVLTPVAFIMVANSVSILISFVVNAVVLITMSAVMVTLYEVTNKKD